MPAERADSINRWLLGGLGLLVLAGAVWMALTIPWSPAASRDQFMLLEAWTKEAGRLNLGHVTILLPGLVTLDIALAGGLTLALSFSKLQQEWLGQLRRALACGGLSALYLFQIRPQEHLDGLLRTACDMTAYVLGAAAVMALLRFFWDYPRRISDTEVRAYLLQQQRMLVLAKPRRRFTLLLENLLTRLDGHDTIDRQVLSYKNFWQLALHPAVYCVTLAVAALAGALFGMTAHRSAGNLASMLAVMLIAFMLPIIAFSAMSAKYRQGSSEDRQRIGWVYLGPVAGIAVAILTSIGPLLASALVPDANSFGVRLLLGVPLIGWWLIGFLCFTPFLIASFLIGLAFSVLYAGTIDPKLALRRGLMVSLSTVLLTGVFVVIENLVTSEVATHFATLSSGTGNLISAIAAALAFGPIKAWTEKASERFIEKLMPSHAMLSAASAEKSEIAAS